MTLKGSILARAGENLDRHVAEPLVAPGVERLGVHRLLPKVRFPVRYRPRPRPRVKDRAGEPGQRATIRWIFRVRRSSVSAMSCSTALPIAPASGFRRK